MSSNSVFTSSESQKRWRDHVKYNYVHSHRIHPCVFQVPDNVRETKPEAYTPQLVGLGPYHHFRAELQRMESRKRAAITDYLEDVSIKDFINIVEQGHDGFEAKIRSCYDRYLDLDKETLAWVVIEDGLFLLHFIDTYLAPDPARVPKIYSIIGALAADVLMLENQIPVILILEMRQVLKQAVIVDSEEDLFIKFFFFCEAESPLKLASNARKREKAFDKNNHMLHFMYQLIVNNTGNADGYQEGSQDNGGGADNTASRIGGLAQELASQGGAILEEVTQGLKSAIADAKSAGVQVSSNVDKFCNILGLLQKTLPFNNKEESPGHEIDIPSACRLNVIGKITFKPLPDDSGIADIWLDEKNAVFYLPVITLGANSEGILRNLVAYEAASKLGSTHIRDYVDLMCGLVDSDKDVKLLKQSGIIQVKKIKRERRDNKYGTTAIEEEEELLEDEIVRMCNGVRRSDEKLARKSKVILETVKDMNDNFNNVGIIKAMRCCAGCVKFLKLLLPLLVMLFIGFQTYCNIFGCRRTSHSGLALSNHYLEELDQEAKLMLHRKLYPY